MANVKLREDNAVYIESRVGDSLKQVIGELVLIESGYMEFFPDLTRGGYWPSWLLRAIADLVDENNAEWDRGIATYFEHHKEIER